MRVPNYELSSEKIDALERELIEAVVAQHCASGIAGVVIDGEHPAANAARSLEARAFAGEGYDFREGMRDHEERSTFGLVLDLDQSRIAHCFRLVTALPASERTATRCGLEVFDDRAASPTADEHMEIAAILEYHGLSEDLSDYYMVATNLRTDRVNESFVHTLAGYKCIFKLRFFLGAPHTVAYLNGRSVRSFGRFGLDYELVGGREFHLPLPGQPGCYDHEYLGVVIPGSESNVNLFLDADPKGSEVQRVISSVATPLYLAAPSGALVPWDVGEGKAPGDPMRPRECLAPRSAPSVR